MTSSTALGMLASSILVMFVLAMTLPRITPEGDPSPDSYWSPSSVPARMREEARAALAVRNAYRRESLGWKLATPARSLIFRPCRSTDGAGVDTDTDGLVDNLTAEDHWRKDWGVHNPAIADPNWTTRSPAEREAALELARRQMGMGSDFGRDNEPPGADCDQQRGNYFNRPHILAQLRTRSTPGLGGRKRFVGKRSVSWRGKA